MRNATQEPLPKRQKRVTRRVADHTISHTSSIMDVINRGLPAWEDRAQAKIDRLQAELDKQRTETNQLQSDKNALQQENLELMKVRVMKCKVCNGQPDRWRKFLCGHMFCEDCKMYHVSPLRILRHLRTGYYWIQYCLSLCRMSEWSPVYVAVLNNNGFIYRKS